MVTAIAAVYTVCECCELLTTGAVLVYILTSHFHTLLSLFRGLRDHSTARRIHILLADYPTGSAKR